MRYCLKNSLMFGRSPHGERGLKSLLWRLYAPHTLSLPTRGAWIEIIRAAFQLVFQESLPTRGAWIEIAFFGLRFLRKGSLPTRGAWIEI